MLLHRRTGACCARWTAAKRPCCCWTPQAPAGSSCTPMRPAAPLHVRLVCKGGAVMWPDRGWLMQQQKCQWSLQHLCTSACVLYANEACSAFARAFGLQELGYDVARCKLADAAAEMSRELAAPLHMRMPAATATRLASTCSTLQLSCSMMPSAAGACQCSRQDGLSS